MLRNLALTFSVLSSAAFAEPAAMTMEEARHLVARTGFGASPAEVTELMGLSYADGVQVLLDRIDATPTVPMPDWTQGWTYPRQEIWVLGQTENERFFTNRWMDIEELSAWWLAEMVATDSPLTERLTLFWHDHFATDYDSHEVPHWMAQQNQFFRDHAAGNFADLATGILRDPAMLTFLSNVWNVKDAPNEDLAREYLELFTLGEGRGYAQADVRAAAQMLTGHSVSEHGAPGYYFRAQEHDRSIKAIFGHEGRFGAADLSRLALSHPDFGPYIVEKLWLEFVSDTPDPAEIARLSAVWIENDLELKPLLREMFLTQAFWDPTNRGRLVKSPIHLLVGTVRTLGVTVPDARDVHWASEEMGQMLFFPPNVGGWPQGVGWINDATATARATVMTDMAGALEDGFEAGELAPAIMASQETHGPVLSAPEDLRVGQVFAMGGWQGDDWFETTIVLYDVSFGGQTWRSIPVQLTHERQEDFAALNLFRGDCAPDCLSGLPDQPDHPGWVRFEPWDGFLAQTKLTPEAQTLLQAVTTHLPSLVASTAAQKSWQEEGRDFTPDDTRRVAERLASDTAALWGPSPAGLVTGFSQPNALGLAGRTGAMMAMDAESYAEAEEQARRIPLIPPVIYANGRDWLNALPGDGPESARARDMLWSLPEVPAMREALIERDPDALIRHLLLAPEFQLY